MIAYQAPSWLPGGHAQTIYPLLIRPTALPYHRERWATPDGDFIDVDWAVPPQSVRADPGRPLLVLFHGLEGSSTSHYAVSLMRALAAIGWTGAVVHFRGCSGELNRLPRAYHSGDSEEVDWILRRLQARFSDRPRYAVGVSLGGNVLLKWLGERGTAASEVLQAAASISAPLDLAASGHHLGRNFNRLYTAYFLRTLKRRARDRLRRFPGLFDEQRMSAARTLYEFDDVVTAPLHGFAGVDDYWRRASSKPWLAGIGLPTLILNATNDPFLPASALPSPHDTARAVRLEFPSHGGHVGFVVGRPPGSIDWLPQRILHFLQHEV